MKKNILAILLAFLMTLSLLPMNASAEEQVPEAAKHTLEIGGQTFDWQWGSFGKIGDYYGRIKGVEYVCQRCLSDPTHHDGKGGTKHAVLISDLIYLIPQIQKKADAVPSDRNPWRDAPLAVIGLTSKKADDNSKNPEIHSFHEGADAIIEVDGGEIYYVIVPVSGKVAVNCISYPDTHETKSYDLVKGTFTTSATGVNEQGQITCQLTVDKLPYIEQYNAEYDSCEHKDVNVENSTVTLELHSINRFDARKNGWANANVSISVKCAPDPVTFDLDDADGAGTHVFNKTLTGNYPENFAEEFKVSVTPDENAASTVTGSSLIGTASVSASSGYEKVPFRFAETGEGEERASAAAQGQLTFSEEGVYRYTVQETAGTTSYMSYDNRSYTLTVTVGEDGGALTVTGWQIDEQENTPLTITNIYRYVPYVPVVPTPTPSKPALNTDDHYAYIVGYPDGTVRPNSQITRAEATTIFFRLLTDASREQYRSTTNAYSDVNAGDWYNNAISTMTRAGIVDGYPDGTFRPNAPITRAEMSKIIALFAKLDRSEDRFSDIAGHWAEGYIKLAAGNGWIEGYPDGTFGPQRNITRAETVTMINRVLERVPASESRLLSASEMLTYPDCRSGQWYYIAIQEAANSHTYQRAVTEKNGDEQWTALRANRDWKMLEQ